MCGGGGRPHALCHGGEQRGLRKVPSMTKSDIIVTNIAISVNKSALLVNRSALSVNIKKCPFSLLLSAFLKTEFHQCNEVDLVRRGSETMQCFYFKHFFIYIKKNIFVCFGKSKKKRIDVWVNGPGRSG